MPGYVPIGYITIDQALDWLGRDRFGSEWTGNEKKARRGLTSPERWEQIKDLPPARGSGATGSGYRGTAPETNRVSPARSENPSDPAYQEEFRASERHSVVRLTLRQRLEAGGLEATVLDPFTGNLHPVSTSVWRRHDADRIIKDGEASIPYSRNTGAVLIKQFEAAKEQKALPQAKIPEVITALNAELLTNRLTRTQQAQFIRKSFPNYRITFRQMNEILQQVPARLGRPRKSGN